MLKELKKEIRAAKRVVDKLQDKYDTQLALEKATIGRMYGNVNVKTRKGSYVLTRGDGKAIVLSRDRNVYGEVNVYEYTTKRGELLLDRTRMHVAQLSKWLEQV